jgi:exosome complex component MTR3
MAQSTFDRRRINGPEDSFPPVFDAVEEHAKIWSARCDRGAEDIRPICTTFIYYPLADHLMRPFLLPVLQPGLISQANGSAYIETARTKLACAV